MKEPKGRRLGRRLAVWLLLVVALLTVVGMAAAGALYVQLARTVDERLAGRRWNLPSRIYSDEFLIYVGLDVVASGLERRLDRLAYREVSTMPVVGGEMRRSSDEIAIALRPGAAGRTRTELVSIRIADGRVSAIEDVETGEEVPTAALEPEELTGIYREELEDRRFTRVTDLPPLLVKAILVTEDSRFFSHHGVDLVGVSRAAVANLRSGEVREGGSTLTQQLMKNFFLSSERTVGRKATEMAMALVTERRYSKMNILEAYLNEIYLGQRGSRGVFGVGEASRFYFGKDPRDLEPQEMALIAGLIRAPNNYSPFTTPDRALQRRNTVLRLLREANEIDEIAYAQAMAMPLGVVPAAATGTDAAWFVDFVKIELARRYGESALSSEGLQIYTSLDPWLQEQARATVSEGLAALQKKHRKLARRAQRDRLEAALLAVSPATGEIRAMVGGRDYASSQFNRVTQAYRQPGSAFKPIVYLAAFATEGPGHLEPTSIVQDAPFSWRYDDQVWTPRNSGRRYRGSVTVRQALELSLNAAAARVARGVGLTAIVDLAHQLGITSHLPRVPSLVLGSVEVTPLELTTAYTALANGGARADLIAIKRVLSRDGELMEGSPSTLTRVVEPEVATRLTGVLQGVLDRGTARDARKQGFTRPAAGKTGTTNDYRDAWFVGYTPDLLASVWVGFDHSSPMHLTGAEGALPLWTRFMTVATAADPPREFPSLGAEAPRRRPRRSPGVDGEEPTVEPDGGGPASPEVAPGGTDGGAAPGKGAVPDAPGGETWDDEREDPPPREAPGREEEQGIPDDRAGFPAREVVGPGGPLAGLSRGAPGAASDPPRPRARPAAWTIDGSSSSGRVGPAGRDPAVGSG